MLLASDVTEAETGIPQNFFWDWSERVTLRDAVEWYELLFVMMIVLFISIATNECNTTH